MSLDGKVGESIDGLERLGLGGLCRWPLFGTDGECGDNGGSEGKFFDGLGGLGGVDGTVNERSRSDVDPVDCFRGDVIPFSNPTMRKGDGDEGVLPDLGECSAPSALWSGRVCGKVACCLCLRFIIVPSVEVLDSWGGRRSYLSFRGCGKINTTWLRIHACLITLTLIFCRSYYRCLSYSCTPVYTYVLTAVLYGPSFGSIERDCSKR